MPYPSDSIARLKTDYLKHQLLANPDILSVSFSYGSPSADGNWNSDFKFDHAQKATNFAANLKWADADYFKTYAIPFVAGGPYEQSDTVRQFVVNETLIHKLGITDPQKPSGRNCFWDYKGAHCWCGERFSRVSLGVNGASVWLLQDVYISHQCKSETRSSSSILPFLKDMD